MKLSERINLHINRTYTLCIDDLNYLDKLIVEKEIGIYEYFEVLFNLAIKKAKVSRVNTVCVEWGLNKENKILVKVDNETKKLTCYYWISGTHSGWFSINEEWDNKVLSFVVNYLPEPHLKGIQNKWNYRFLNWIANNKKNSFFVVKTPFLTINAPYFSVSENEIRKKMEISNEKSIDNKEFKNIVLIAIEKMLINYHANFLKRQSRKVKIPFKKILINNTKEEWVYKENSKFREREEDKVEATK
ncbi:hypothetical protein ACWXVT_02170 [Mycoplasma sp. 1573]